MIKDRSLYKYQTEWFKGYNNKLYKIVVNNLFKVGIIDLLRIKRLNKNKKLMNLYFDCIDSEKKYFDIIIFTTPDNVVGLRNLSGKLKLDKHIIEKSIFNLPMIIVDTYSSDLAKDDGWKDLKLIVEKEVKRIYNIIKK